MGKKRRSDRASGSLYLLYACSKFFFYVFICFGTISGAFPARRKSVAGTCVKRGFRDVSQIRGWILFHRCLCRAFNEDKSDIEDLQRQHTQRQEAIVHIPAIAADHLFRPGVRANIN